MAKSAERKGLRAAVRLAWAAAATAAWVAFGCDDGGAGPSRVGKWEVAYRVATAPQSLGVTDLWFNGPGDGWACVDGRVLRYAGGRWTVFGSLGDAYPAWKFKLRTVCAPAADDVWVGGEVDAGTEAPHLFHYTAGGWTRVDLPMQTDVFDLYFDGPAWGWAGGDNALFYYDGNAWVPFGPVRAWSFSFVDRQTGWLCALDNGGSEVYRWDGALWWLEALDFPREYGYFSHVSGVAADDAWLTGAVTRPGTYTTGVIYHYDGGGWRSVAAPETPWGVCDFRPAGRGWVFADGLDVKAWYCDGDDFRSYVLPCDGLYVNAVWTNAADDVWAATAAVSGYAYILHFAGFGED